MIILLIYTGLVIIIYFICIFTNIYRWISKLKDKIYKQQKIISKQKTTIKQITSNRDGLLNQFKNDQKEKEDLQYNFDLLHNIYLIAFEYIQHIESKKLAEFNERVKLERQKYKIEKDTNSKNNKHKKISD